MLPPLRFHALYKPRSWGPVPEQSRLVQLGKRGLPVERVGESWEIADLPDSIEDGQTRLRGGAFEGSTLRAIRAHHRDELLGIATPAPDGGFPLLVKFLDAAENLSIQVHPDAAYVRSHPETHLKTEAWIILDAKPGAVVYRGLRPDTTREMFRTAVETGRALEHLQSFAVSRGDCVYLPSGICHALGAGVLAAEIQTPSDTTFRVWDWSRNDPKRPLHLAQAFACMKFGSAQSDGRPAVISAALTEPMEAGGLATRVVCRSEFFTIEWIEAACDGARSTSPATSQDFCEAPTVPLYASGVPEVWMTLAGRTRWQTASADFVQEAGETVLRPAQCEPGAVRLERGTTVLRAICASSLDRAISSHS